MIYVLRHHNSRSRHFVNLSQIKSAHDYAEHSGIWTGQALAFVYLEAHKKFYGIRLSVSPQQAAWLARDLKPLVRVFGETARDLINTLFENKKLQWVTNRREVVGNLHKMQTWVHPVWHFETNRRTAGEQAEWAAPDPAADGPKSAQVGWSVDAI